MKKNKNFAPAHKIKNTFVKQMCFLFCAYGRLTGAISKNKYLYNVSAAVSRRYAQLLKDYSIL